MGRFAVVEGPLRKSFQQELVDIDTRVVQLFALVSESLAAATDMTAGTGVVTRGILPFEGMRGELIRTSG